jgi:hypothetical protein
MSSSFNSSHLSSSPHASTSSKLLLRAISTIQIALGLLYLLAPQWLLAQMGHSAAPADLVYPLAMLAARFLAYGAGLWIAAGAPQAHRLWIRLMVLVQLIDLGAGLAATATGIVPLSLSGFPMFNAVWIAAVCWRISSPTPAAAAAA